MNGTSEHTNRTAADDAVVDNGWAILSNFKAVVFVMRNGRWDIWAELERDVAQVGRSCAFRKRHRWIRVSFDRYIFGHVARRTAENVDIVFYYQELALVGSFVHEHQRTFSVVEKLQSRLDCFKIGNRTSCQNQRETMRSSQIIPHVVQISSHLCSVWGVWEPSLGIPAGRGRHDKVVWSSPSMDCRTRILLSKWIRICRRPCGTMVYRIRKRAGTTFSWNSSRHILVTCRFFQSNERVLILTKAQCR